VCSKCSGLFRELNFRVKGISMSNFTQEEVDQLVKGGNGVAKKLWLSSWTSEDCSIPDPGDEKRIKMFIKLCFERAQWKELPTSEPLENLVGKDVVKNLKFGKNNPSTSKDPPPKPTLPVTNPLPKPEEPEFEPFGSQPIGSNVWDPFGSTNNAPVKQPSPRVNVPNGAPPNGPNPTPSTGANHNPFSAFTAPQPTQPFPNNSTTISNPSLQPHLPVDPHTLFVSISSPVQPTQPVTHPYVIVSNPYAGPAVYPNQPYPPYGINHWVQPITVKPQVPAVQTGPDAFSGLLPGFTKTTAVNPIK